MLSRNNYIDLAAGKFNETTAEDLSALFAAIEQSDAREHLVVHFHGGLVSRASAEQAADALLPAYQMSGAYPVFFFWRSDLWTTFSRNLDHIAQEPAFQRLVKRLLLLALAKLDHRAGLKAAGPLPVVPDSEAPDDPAALAEYAAAREPREARGSGVELTDSQMDQVEFELETDEVLIAESRAIAEGAAPPAETAEFTARGAAGGRVQPRPTLMSRHVQAELVEGHSGEGDRVGLVAAYALAKHGLTVLIRVIKRFAQARDHGVYATVVEEILRELYLDSVGGLAWELMKSDTSSAFGSDAQVFGGAAFVGHLKAWWKPGRRVTLIGHSTGAIYIGNLLEHADAVMDQAAKFDVIFLAPACSFEFMTAKLPGFERRVRRLRLFGLQDALERGYWEVPALYPASLLYLVSGLFEEAAVDMPIVGMQRYFSGNHPYETPEFAAVTQFLKDKCVWSLAEGAAGLNCGAIRHGGFDADPSTLASIGEFLSSREGG